MNRVPVVMSMRWVGSRRGSTTRVCEIVKREQDAPDGAVLYVAWFDSVAWMEVYLGERWWTFALRNNRRRNGQILIGSGCDASDTAMVTTVGAQLLGPATVGACEWAARVTAAVSLPLGLGR